MAPILIGEVAQRTGLAVSAVRYYEEMGLVSPGRTAGGLRVFERADIRRLSFVMIAQRLGFSIADIRKALSSLPDGRAPTKRDWTRLSRHFRSELEMRIKGLTELRDRLDGCIGCGCLSLELCELHNSDDIATANGSGRDTLWVMFRRSRSPNSATSKISPAPKRERRSENPKPAL